MAAQGAGVGGDGSMPGDGGVRGVDRKLTSYGDPGYSRYARRAFLASAGYDAEDLERPVVALVDTSSDYTTCHRDMPALVEAAKRGVLEAGAIPLVCPTMSLGELMISPTSMLFRNLMAMETEELLTAYPLDAAVLFGGCDKTLPAQLMAAASANVPSVCVVTGPMRTGDWRGERVGACTDCRRYWQRYRAGELEEGELEEVEQSLCTTGGTCAVMGTASTMACATEALGMMLPGGATAPSGSGDRLRHAAAAGRAAAALALSDQPRTPRDVLTGPAFDNAIRVLAAVGGSTNAVIHLTAVARRAGVALSLADFDRICAEVPRLVSCKPAGDAWLEDMHRAGGVPTLLKALEPLLSAAPEVADVAGTSLAARLADQAPPQDWQDVIRSLDRPHGPAGALAVVSGSLAPDGAVIKTAAATPELLQHTGPAVVFDSPADAAARIDDPALGITADHVIVLRNAGPVAAGMPEAGSLPIPSYLASAGVTDVVRVSDARMSGTAYGTVVLHAAPEAAAGGPLALVEDGDRVALDVAGRRLDLLVDEAELERRRAAWRPPPLPSRGWRRLYADRVMQAPQGADLDFLAPGQEAGE